MQAVMRNTLGNWEKPLGTGLRNTLGPPPFTNTVSLHGIASMLSFFQCRLRSAWSYQDHQGGHVQNSQMTHPSTGALASTSCPMSGMRSCRTPQPSILGNHPPPFSNGATSHGIQRGHTFFMFGNDSPPKPSWGCQFPPFATSIC